MPRAQEYRDQETFSDLAFPGRGIDVSTGYSQQRRGTTPLGVNVRTFEPGTNRSRGGQRSGLSKYISARPSGSSGLIQELACLVGVGYSPPGGSSQTSQSGRVVTLVAVQGGRVYAAAPGGSAWSVASTSAGDPPLATSGVVRSAANNQDLYFADGAHYCYYDPAAHQVKPWVATAGSLPQGPSGARPRLVSTWRGRTVLSGIADDAQNWFMSRVSDPTDFDYAPLDIAADQAIAGNNSPLGLIGDVVTSLVPFTDDVLVMGGDHTIWQFSGDPMSGGQIDLVSDAIGMAWGAPWCKGPDGTLYFVSNRTGIYAYRPGEGAPVRISQQIEQLLVGVDTGTSVIRLVWDDRFQGLHVFLSPAASGSAATHYFWESRVPSSNPMSQGPGGAWWQDVFFQNDHNPLAVCVFDGNDAGDRRPLIGSWDGYVRAVDPEATDDDGTAISSSVVLGPLVTANLDDLLLKDLQAVLSSTSGTVTWAAHVGPTAESALSLGAVASGTWSAGRNHANLIRRSGHAIWVKLTAAAPWAFEAVRARLAGQGKARRRN